MTTIEERAAAWMEKTHPGIENWKLGNPSKSKRVAYIKEEQHSEKLPDGMVVPILPDRPGVPITFYQEPSE